MLVKQLSAQTFEAGCKIHSIQCISIMYTSVLSFAQLHWFSHIAHVEYYLLHWDNSSMVFALSWWIYVNQMLVSMQVSEWIKGSYSQWINTDAFIMQASESQRGSNWAVLSVLYDVTHE